MRCFVFPGKRNDFPDICGTTPLRDIVFHLQSLGISEIFCSEDPGCGGVSVMSYQSARPHLGSEWFAAWAGCITRQSPIALRESALTSAARCAISLSCSAKPWEHLSVLTDGMGFVEKIENNPPPENAETNLCFSGFLWTNCEAYDPVDLLQLATTKAVLLPGYWRCPDSRENYLLTVHDILRREVTPWPHLQIPEHGVVVNSQLPADIEVYGTLWIGRNCRVGEGCILENCVILDGSAVGGKSSLRNCLVMPGMRIPGGTVQNNKYLSFPGDEDGREH